MMYEISKEIFKQRLCNKLNFAIVEVSEQNKSTELKETVHIKYDGQFVNAIKSKYPNNAQNIIVYSLNPSDQAPQKAATDLKEAGYNFVYFYNGDLDDVILDKGLN